MHQAQTTAKIDAVTIQEIQVAVPNVNEDQLKQDTDLVERCLISKDGSAFESLLICYQNMVFNLAFRFMGNRQEAEDLSQEVFLKVYKSLDSYRGASTLKTWIYRITTNMALNRLKFLKRRHENKQVSIDQDRPETTITLKESLPDQRPGQLQEIHADQIAIRLQRALDSISEDQKAVIILRDIEGFSYDDIASTLGTNVGTVKSRLARGRTQVQEIMRDML